MARRRHWRGSDRAASAAAPRRSRRRSESTEHAEGWLGIATTAKTILWGAETADRDVPSDALAMLMHQAGIARREAARSILEPMVGTKAWQQLKHSVERELQSYAAASIESLHPRLLMIAEATVRILPDERTRGASALHFPRFFLR